MAHLCLVFVMLWVLQFLETHAGLIHAGPEMGVASKSVYDSNYSINMVAKSKGTIAW
jgi:hypothetical protein